MAPTLLSTLSLSLLVAIKFYNKTPRLPSRYRSGTVTSVGYVLSELSRGANHNNAEEVTLVTLATSITNSPSSPPSNNRVIVTLNEY